MQVVGGAAGRYLHDKFGHANQRPSFAVYQLSAACCIEPHKEVRLQRIVLVEYNGLIVAGDQAR